MTVDVDINHESLRQQAFDLLHGYSEWLDADKKLIRCDFGDTRTHDDLVREYLSSKEEKN